MSRRRGRLRSQRRGNSTAPPYHGGAAVSRCLRRRLAASRNGASTAPLAARDRQVHGLQDDLDELSVRRGRGVRLGPAEAVARSSDAEAQRTRRGDGARLLGTGQFG